jgi:hypothetical protein
MKVSVEYIKWLRSELKKINKVKLRDIEFFENGMVLKHTDEELREFEFTGLNNTDFIETEHYKINLSKE